MKSCLYLYIYIKYSCAKSTPVLLYGKGPSLPSTGTKDTSVLHLWRIPQGKDQDQMHRRFIQTESTAAGAARGHFVKHATYPGMSNTLVSYWTS